MGRPAYEVTEEVIKKAEEFASRGLTLEQVAHCLGIHRDTLNEKKKIYNDLSDAIKRGQAKGIDQVTNFLFDNCRNGNVTAQIFYLKCRANWDDKTREQNEDKEKSTIAEVKKSVQKCMKPMK